MIKTSFIVICIFCLLLSVPSITSKYSEYGENEKWPTVMFCVLARNKQHTLPYFLTLMNNLDYPKDRIVLSIHSDHNEDLTAEVLKMWFSKHENEYHRVDMQIDEEYNMYVNSETDSSVWSKSRFQHVVTLRNNCLKKARNIWANFLFMLDADTFLTLNTTLKDLIVKDLNIVSPMLKSNSLYSNFWCGMTSGYYYTRTEDYLPTLDREKVGCFNVPMIHSAVLINLFSFSSDQLSYDPGLLIDYNGPYDDVIAFALSANASGEPLYICNDNNYGYVMTPLEQNEKLNSDTTNDIVLQSIADDSPIFADHMYDHFLRYPTPDKMGFDQIYMINLKRRPQRRKKMLDSFKELGINAKIFDAIDGQELNAAKLNDIGISFLPGYLDPHEKRPMTAGEVGCFMSHYYIWKEIVDENLNVTLILEDDVRFEPNFRRNVEWIMNEIESRNIKWDLIYLGRKPMAKAKEPGICHGLVYAGYSYWTLAYIINNQGANKLINAKPLEKLVPVDEFLPIMFDKHTNPKWSSFYKTRNLIALSVHPLFVYPTHYTGQPGHFSDTEHSIQAHEL